MFKSQVHEVTQSSDVKCSITHEQLDKQPSNLMDCLCDIPHI